MILSSEIFADCKITKHTYEVVSNNKTCHYTSFWREGYVGKMYKAQSYNLKFSPECESFQKPLKGKLIKDEFIRDIIGSGCSFIPITEKTK